MSIEPLMWKRSGAEKAKIAFSIEKLPFTWRSSEQEKCKQKEFVSTNLQRGRVVYQKKAHEKRCLPHSALRYVSNLI